MSSNVEDVLTVAATAQLLGCAERTVEEQARVGDLPGLKYGDGGWIFPRAALLQRLVEKALDQASSRRAAREPVPPPFVPVAGTAGKRRKVRPNLGALCN